MNKPKVCLICKEIVTFCECDKSITGKNEYIVYLEYEDQKFKEEYLWMFNQIHPNPEHSSYNMGMFNRVVK